MAPIVHGLAAEYTGKINFVYLDIDDPANADFKQQLGFQYQPQIFLLDEDGNIQNEWVGPVTEGELRSALDDSLVQ
jgi:thioredoxin-like negative regulator of GroEL